MLAEATQAPFIIFLPGKRLSLEEPLQGFALRQKPYNVKKIIWVLVCLSQFNNILIR